MPEFGVAAIRNPVLTGAAGVWHWQAEPELLFADARFAALCGLDADQAKDGLPTSAFFSAIHPDDRLRVRIAVAGVMHGADVFVRDYRVVDADGSIRWVAARGEAHRDADQNLIRFTGVLSDVTDQKRVEERLRVAQMAGGVGSFEYIGGFGTVAVSEQFCRLLGLHPADALPIRTVNSLVHPDDPPLIGADAGEGALTYREVRVTRADTGEVRWIARRGEMRPDDQLSGQRFIGVIYDITASKSAQEQLRRLADTLEERVAERTRERDRIWNRSRDLLAVIDQQGLLRAASPSWRGVLDQDPALLNGHAFDALVAEPHRERARAALRAALDGADLDNFEVELSAPHGSRWISWRTSFEDGLVYAYGRDVTDERTQAIALSQTEDQLRQAQKMEAVGQLTGGLAHDFNNMLTGIIGGLDMVRRRVAEGRLADLDRFIDAATKSAERAASLTHRLLAFSRRQTLDPQGVDVNGLVRSMEDLLRRTLGEQTSLVVELDEGLWPALSDINQLESALLNLAINARDAMPAGGTLAILTTNVVVEDMGADNDLSAGDYVRIAVSDTGVGMDADVVSKVFDPFFTTKPIGQGTGLGLSMVYGFVRQIGGRVDIGSQPGAGTTIAILLPRHAVTAVRVDPAAIDAAPAPRGAGETVLVVEDDESVRLLILEILAELGYKALHAEDGISALPILQSGSKIDLMITDVGLPGLNGRQLAKMARDLRPDLRVLFVTGYAADAAVRADFTAPGMDLVFKPFAIEDLGRKIRAMIEGAEPVSQV